MVDLLSSVSEFWSTFFPSHEGPVAQWIEHRPPEPGVARSNRARVIDLRRGRCSRRFFWGLMTQDPTNPPEQIPLVPADTWVIGDVHGCHDTLMELLRQIDDRQPNAHLTFIGDLVGKGPDSLGVIRFMLENAHRVSVTLGNHDLHLLACRKGKSTPRPSDRTEALLELPQGHPWEAWLSQQPFALDLQAEQQDLDPWRLIHAGVHPAWSESETRERLAQLHAHSRSNSWDWYKDDQSRAWQTASVLTRIRCLKLGTSAPDGEYTGPPENAPEDLAPWYTLLKPENHQRTYLFGHWARLGWHRHTNALCLDSGCVYGGKLTAFQPISGETIRQENCESPTE